MSQHTPLHGRHVALGARMVDFGGWDMPLQYGSQIEEHQAVRQHVGLFDVSHMCAVDLRGPGVRAFLSRLLANDVGRLTVAGKALYSCLLAEDGGVIDDLIAYYLDESWFRLVVNAGTAPKDLAWIRRQADGTGIDVIERRDLAMIAVQGPAARELVASLLDAGSREAALALGPFFGRQLGEYSSCGTGLHRRGRLRGRAAVDGGERFLGPVDRRGGRPCGLGARDTLRLEAGMNLYGNDMDESVTPLESGLAWTVVLTSGRDFIGRAALEAQRARGDLRRFVGLLLEDKGVLRGHMRVVVEGVGDGETTSGGYSPTLARSIAFARVPAGTGERVAVEVRGRLLAARVVKLPFVRHGQAQIAL